MSYSASNPPPITGTSSTDINPTTPETLSNKQLIDQIAEKMVNKKPIVDESINQINNITDRVEKGLFTLTNEFAYQNTNKIVKEGVPYHIHYTKDSNVYYMTRSEHSQIQSKLMYRIAGFKPMETYNFLNKQSPYHLEPKIVIPKEEDYNDESFTRYFAKKANENSSPFEISETDFQSSPLYEYVELEWFISGDKTTVRQSNEISIRFAEGESTFRNLKKILPDFQYYRESSNLNSRERVVALLDLENKTQISPQAQTQPTTSTQQPAPSGYNAGSGGPPPGVSTGGAGGGGGY